MKGRGIFFSKIPARRWLVLLLAGTLSLGWAEEPAATPPEDQDLLVARQVAINALDLLYSGGYAQVADMMNPDPPRWKGSKEELHKARSGDLNTMAMARAAYGLRLALECTHAARITLPKRPASEEFFEFTFKSTYGDDLKATDLPVIVKKDGQFYIERFR